MIILTYKELARLKTFEERFEYLKLTGRIGEETFGFDRYINQKFYKSAEWKSIRNFVIARDLGCDLGIEGYEIFAKPIIHHMNPITVKDITELTEFLTDPNFLITVSHETHNAIHYGSEQCLRRIPVERKPNDTCPWK